MSLIKGIHHVKLTCLPEQMETVQNFYENVIGMKLLSKHEDCAILDTGRGIFELFCDAEKLLGQGDYRHVAFETDDVANAIKTCEEYGCKVKEYPVNVIFGLAEPTPATIGFVYGPIGEEIEFFQIREA